MDFEEFKAWLLFNGFKTRYSNGARKEVWVKTLPGVTALGETMRVYVVICTNSKNRAYVSNCLLTAMLKVNEGGVSYDAVKTKTKWMLCG